MSEWISVKDRLPDDEQEVLVIAHGWDGRLVYVGSHKRVNAAGPAPFPSMLVIYNGERVKNE